MIMTATCPACGSKDSVSTGVALNRYVRGTGVWSHCRRCRSFFYPAKYDRQADLLYTISAPYGSPESGMELNQFKRRMYRNVLTLIRKFCAPPATLLDIGCAYGGFLLEAREAGYAVLGSDILPNAVQYVQSVNIPAQISSCIGDVSLIKDGTLDILTCLDCNCYWHDQSLQIREACNKLKPGGYLAMRVVDKSWLFAIGLRIHSIDRRLAQLFMAQAVNDHRFSMPIKSLLRLITSNGFTIAHASTAGALHSDNSRIVAKVAFGIGSLLWKILRIPIGPGALILARKRLPA
jgi:SAM-dependent methyltransferase